MRHSSCRTTLDVYTARSTNRSAKRNLKVVGWMPPVDLQKFQHPSAASGTQKVNRRCRQVPVNKGVILVDLIGIEPMSASTPFYLC